MNKHEAFVGMFFTMVITGLLCGIFDIVRNGELTPIVLLIGFGFNSLWCYLLED